VSGRQKAVLVLVAVALVALFVVAVAGRRPGDGNPGGHNAFVAWLAKFGGGQATVPASLVTASCPLAGGTLTVNGSCTVHVADPKSLKMLVLRARTGFQVTAPAPGHADYAATQRVTPKDDGVAEARIAVDKPSDVFVACTGALSCALTVGEG
jgi:hypothetical protein